LIDPTKSSSEWNADGVITVDRTATESWQRPDRSHGDRAA
jgi:hypothetical protein